MGRKCCAPGCRSNYGTENKYTTIFHFPKDPDRRKLWLIKIRRKDFEPTSTSVLCIRHFEERFIIREDRAIRDDGSELVVARKKLALTPDAYPTIFSYVPKYINGLKTKSLTPSCKEVPKVKEEVVPTLPQPTASSIYIENPVVKMEATTPVHHSSPVYDLCIVGAGMFGSAAARHASANVGIKICLVGPEEPTPEEMVNKEIFGSHYDEGRIASTLDDDVPTQILSKNSIKRFRELERLSGIDFYFPVGFLWISKSNSPSSKAIIQGADTLNLPIVDLSFNDIFERRYPYIKIRNDDHPLLDDFGAGHINPRNLIAAQKTVARNQGCDIINDVVHEVKPLTNGIHEIITENQGIIKAKRILICTGAFTNFKKFPMPKLQFNIHKETAALLKIDFKEARRLSAMPSIVYYRPEDNLGAYILPPILYPDGCHYLKIGHADIYKKGDTVTSLEEVKNWYLSKGDPVKIGSLSKFLIDMLPGLKCEQITEMTCVTSHNASGVPFIDRISSTVTVAVVGNGRGAQYSDEVGRIAAALSVTGQWESELPKSPFQVMYCR